MRPANTLWRNGKKTLRKKYDEYDIDDERKKNCPKKTKPEDWVRFVDLTSVEDVKASRERNKVNRSKMMEVDPTTTRLDSFLVGHTRSDGTYPAAFIEKKMIKKSITLGVIGLPNVGKSSLINSLKRCHVVNVGTTLGLTRSKQEIHLDKNIKLLDCPGVVMYKSGGSDSSITLRNCK
ncbi:hypothetical protein GIB67_021441 [Kingdonia uniflora]|uniref:G domain-containing protein n=1 Tax=Kingdonia uniflora TaxID=39325 RepID=A0A7J7NR89_9MAGN|nr:hypothetical protein GIB67_021441 [Kingdonia uniflora]